MVCLHLKQRHENIAEPRNRDITDDFETTPYLWLVVFQFRIQLISLLCCRSDQHLLSRSL